jgi:hypothetical protein
MFYYFSEICTFTEHYIIFSCLLCLSSFIFINYLLLQSSAYIPAQYCFVAHPQFLICYVLLLF